MKNIILTGFMGTGKTEVGKAIARILSMKLVDIDAEIEKSERKAISDIFRDSGEPFFRNVETAMIKTVSSENGVIISTGGGAVLREENLAVLAENGLIFCLNADAETIMDRTCRSNNRPLLQVDDPLSKIKQLLAARAPYYAKAGIMISTDGKTPLQIAEEIIEIWKCRE